MARRRKRSSGRTFGKIRRFGRRSAPSGLDIGAIGGAMAYGALRAKLSGWVTPITQNIPLGNIADEVVLGVGNYLLYKNVSMPLVKKAAFAGLMIESARVGDALASGAISMNSTSSSTGYVYG